MFLLTIFDFVSYKYQIRAIRNHMKMKLLTRTLFLLTIASLTLFFANCGGGGGDEKTPQQVQLGKLSKTWVLGTATLDGISSPLIGSDFALTISGSFNSGSPDGPYNYSVTGTLTPSPWPASGTWTFDSISGDGGQIIREDGVGITYSIGTDGRLTLNFTCAACDYAGARTSQANGDWVFILD